MRGLPKRSPMAPIYTRMNLVSPRNGVSTGIRKLQSEPIVRIKIELFALDSTSIKCIGEDGRSKKKRTFKALASRAADGNTKVHLVAGDARTAITFALTPALRTCSRRSPLPGGKGD